MTRKRKFLVVLLLTSISLGSAAAWIGVGALAGAYWYLNPKLPTVDVLKEARMQQPLRVYSADGKLIAEFGEKRRIPIEIDDVPELVKLAFLAAEDDRFEEHPGVDYRGLIRAVLNQILKGDRSQGGSTITMQVARNFFLTPEKTYIRKLNEIFLALKIERELSKDKILELYLNKIYLGKRAYGVSAAAQAYYGKPLVDLDLAQTAMVAGLPKAPSTFNPIANPQRALQRRNYILARMRDLAHISSADFEQAVVQPITAGTHEVVFEVEAPYLAEMVRAEMVSRYGEEAYTSGMRVYTSIDSRLQAAANNSLREGLLQYTERHGYRGPISVTILEENLKRIELTVEEAEEAEEELVLLDDEPIAENAQPDASENTVEIMEPKDPNETHIIPRKEIDEIIEAKGRFGEVRPAYVLEISETELTEEEQKTKTEDAESTTTEIASIYLGAGEYGQLNFDSIGWAKGYISVNEQGPEPKLMRDVLLIGDLIWIRPLNNDEENTKEQADTDEEQQDIEGLEEEKSWQLTQLPEVEGSLVTLDPQNGAVISLVGGFDYFKSKFNRAVQAKRQPGSGFKPFVYSAALENGFTAASIINDAPVVFDDPALEGKWKPENYSGRFFGPTRLREGIVRSRNLVSIRLLISLGIAKARRYAKRFGLDDDALPRDLSLALGSGTLSPLNQVSGFSAFANQGYRIEPFFVDRIENEEGSVLWYADYGLSCLQCAVDDIDPVALEEDYIVEWPVLDSEEDEVGGEQQDNTADQLAVLELKQDAAESELSTAEESDLSATEEAEIPGDNPEDGELAELEFPKPKRVLRQAPRIMDERVNFIMNSILRDVVLRGTGRRALALGRNDLAGKTGTSNDEHDAWFNGFNYKYATSVWVGFDIHQPLGAGEAGSRAALPIWVDYMREALEGVPEKLPDLPDGVVTTRIDSRTGLLATTNTKESVFEVFRTENVPTEKSEEIIDFPLEDSEAETNTPTTRSGTSVTEELF